MMIIFGDLIKDTDGGHFLLLISIKKDIESIEVALNHANWQNLMLPVCLEPRK